MRSTGPYACAVLFAIGVALTTVVFNLYFMNLPLHGEPISIGDYFTGNSKSHILGLSGGIVWCIGTVALFAASSAPAGVNLGSAVSYGLGQGATVISALWGLFVWKEFDGANSRVRMLLALMLSLFLAGLGMVSVALYMASHRSKNQTHSNAPFL
ncbi:MAG: hypothetical protein WKF37_13785 [Bryobacteraceae bacterium]